MTWLRSVIAAGLLFGASTAVASEKAPVRPQFRVNTTTYGNQGRYNGPDVAADAEGNFVVVWDDSYLGIFGQRYDNVGRRLGGEFEISTFTDYPRRPAVSAAPGGNFVIVWANGYYNIMARRYSPLGVALGPPFQVNTYTADYPRNPKIASDGAGNFVVVWGQFAYTGGIDGQRFDATGTPIGTEFEVNTITSGGHGYNGISEDDDGIEIAMNSAGSFMVVWETYASDGHEDGVFARFFDGTGTPSGPDFQVNTYTTGEQNYPAIATDGSGSFVVVWNDERDIIVARRYDPMGTAVAVDFQVSTGTAYRTRPGVSADAAGNFVVVWGDGYYIRGQQVDATDALVGAEFQLATPNAYGDSDGRLPDVAGGEDGNFVVAWHSYNSDGQYGYGGVAGQLFGEAPVPCTAAPMNTCHGPTLPRKGVLRMREGATDAGDLLVWQWSRGEATTLAELGDPFDTTSYALCVYDASAAPQPLINAVAPAGQACGAALCWRPIGSSIFEYLDPSRFADGLLRIRVRTGAEGNARILVSAGGANVALPALPMTPPVTVQLQAANGSCWSADYSQFILDNEAGRFRAKPDGP